MKNIIKILGIVALIATFSFTMTACENVVTGKLQSGVPVPDYVFYGTTWTTGAMPGEVTIAGDDYTYTLTINLSFNSYSNTVTVSYTVGNITGSGFVDASDIRTAIGVPLSSSPSYTVDGNSVTFAESIGTGTVNRSASPHTISAVILGNPYTFTKN
jgi:hypothetical protein